MGKLIYDGAEVAFFDDRLLSHLQIAIGSKLRRQESFFLSWTDEMIHGSGRTAIWIDSHLSVTFRYSGGKTPSLNRAWVEELVASGYSPQGMRVTAEPQE